MKTHETHHWTGAGGVGLFGAAVGALLGNPALLLAGAVGVAYAGAAIAGGPPLGEHAAIVVSRTVSDTDPEPGEDIRVTVTVENEGDARYPDLRVVDGVPEALTVVEGSPRFATALPPGGTRRFTYAVRARRGHHEWDGTELVAADPTDSVEVAARTDTTDTLTAVPTFAGGDDLALDPSAALPGGRLDTDRGGAGVEFHSVREYRRGDPLARIDWRRLARTREMATVEFREQRSVDVVLVVDARRQAHRVPEPGAADAVDRAVEAVGRLFDPLLADGNRVGIAAVGRHDCWLPPGSGQRHRKRARDLLANDPAFTPEPPETNRFGRFGPERRRELREAEIERLHERFPTTARVVLCGPCCDDYLPLAARRFDALGRSVTVLSPDPTTDTSPAERLAGVERDARLRDLRERVRTLDWGPEEPLALALSRATARRGER